MKINCVLFSLYFLLSAAFAFAQDTTRVLFIGNSFTYYNNMPQLFKGFADSTGKKVITGMHAPGGISVGDTAQGTVAHMNNPALFALIRSQKWDFAVIQDNQGRFVRDSGVFSGASKVLQGHLNIMDSVKANNDCAKIILFGGWAWKNGMPPYGNTGIECIKRILVNYRVLNDTMMETIAPIGEAWIKAFKYLPSVNLWDADDAHPSYAGSYLTASVIFSSIFNLPVKNVNYNGSLPANDASKLRAFSDSSVFDAFFHKRYNLGGVKKITPLYANGVLSLPGNFSSYSWYKAGVFISNSATLTSQGNGIYKAVATEPDGCIIKSCSYRELATGISKEQDIAGIDVFPNPVKEGILTIRSEMDISSVELLSVSGIRCNPHLERFPGSIRVITKKLSPGCYTLLLRVKDAFVQRKIMILE